MTGLKIRVPRSSSNPCALQFAWSERRCTPSKKQMLSISCSHECQIPRAPSVKGGRKELTKERRSRFVHRANVESPSPEISGQPAQKCSSKKQNMSNCSSDSWTFWISFPRTLTQLKNTTKKQKRSSEIPDGSLAARASESGPKCERSTFDHRPDQKLPECGSAEAKAQRIQRHAYYHNFDIYGSGQCLTRRAIASSAAMEE